MGRLCWASGVREGRTRVKGNWREGSLAAAMGLEAKVMVGEEEIRALPSIWPQLDPPELVAGGRVGSQGTEGDR